MRVHFIDVGQGAATLVEFPCGALLIDTGGEDNSEYHGVPALLAYLDAFFARRTDLHRTIDVLLLTHPHIDHVRGAPAVLSTFAVRSVVDDGREARQEDAVVAMTQVRDFLGAHPEIDHTSVRLRDFPSATDALKSPALDPFLTCEGVDPGVQALWGGLDSDPGWGENDYGNALFDNDNNHSVVTRVDFGAASLLVTGDLEEVAIRELVTARGALLDADIYQVGHHGSHNGTTADLLRAMSPAWAVMAVGPASRTHSWTAWAYGHPREKTVSLLEGAVSGSREAGPHPVGVAMKRFVDFGVTRAVYATGWDGTVVLEASSLGLITVGKADVPVRPGE
jgi:competence protein ComEC